MNSQKKSLIIQSMLALVCGTILAMVVVYIFSAYTLQVDFSGYVDPPLFLRILDVVIVISVIDATGLFYMRHMIKRLTNYSITSDALMLAIGVNIATWAVTFAISGLFALTGVDPDKLGPLPFLVFAAIIWLPRAYLWCYIYDRITEEVS